MVLVRCPAACPRRATLFLNGQVLRRFDAFAQHGCVANVVRQNQDQAVVEQLGLFGAQAGVGVEQINLKAVSLI